MSSVIYTDAKLFIGGFNLSADHNELGLDYSSEMQDVTTFGDDTRVRTGGLDTATVNGSGFWNGGTNNADQAFFDFTGATSEPLLLFGDGINVGSPGNQGFAMKAVVANYNIGNPVGDMMNFSVTAESAGTE